MEYLAASLLDLEWHTLAATAEPDAPTLETVALTRKNILEKGYSEKPMVLYERFRGRQPSVEPLLERRGLKQGR